MAKRTSKRTAAKAELINAEDAKKFARMYVRLEAERRECFRLAAAKTKALDGMEAVLIPFVDANKVGRARTITVGDFVLTVGKRDKGLFYKGALIEEIGQAKFDKRMKEAGKVDDLKVEPATNDE